MKCGWFLVYVLDLCYDWHVTCFIVEQLLHVDSKEMQTTTFREMQGCAQYWAGVKHMNYSFFPFYLFFTVSRMSTSCWSCQMLLWEWVLEFVCERQLAEEYNYVLITLWSILVLFDFKIAYNHALTITHFSWQFFLFSPLHIPTFAICLFPHK